MSPPVLTCILPVPTYAPTYLWAAINIAVPMHKGESNKTIQANIK